MKHKSLVRDIHKRELYIKMELAQRVIKTITFNFKNNARIFTVLNNGIKKNQSNPFRTHIRNSCIISGRSKAVHKRFKISRILLRELSGKGYFFGLKKGS
jgi:ribosomal protein S14